VTSQLSLAGRLGTLQYLKRKRRSTATAINETVNERGNRKTSRTNNHLGAKQTWTKETLLLEMVC
jgi:hypothetical protein